MRCSVQPSLRLSRLTVMWLCGIGGFMAVSLVWLYRGVGSIEIRRGERCAGSASCETASALRGAGRDGCLRYVMAWARSSVMSKQGFSGSWRRRLRRVRWLQIVWPTGRGARRPDLGAWRGWDLLAMLSRVLMFSVLTLKVAAVGDDEHWVCGDSWVVAWSRRRSLLRGVRN